MSDVSVLVLAILGAIVGAFAVGCLLGMFISDRDHRDRD
jgi:uncharacterized protein YneF (UPF0154 family)